MCRPTDFPPYGGDDMLIKVRAVEVPAMSTIGFGYGDDPDGNRVIFIGDHRPMRDLLHALATESDVYADAADYTVRREVDPDEWEGNDEPEDYEP